MDLYRRLLLPLGHGYPLFDPQPSDDLPELARRIGTEIGDVGIFTADGGFHPIYNILRAKDDPVNRFGVPNDFEPVYVSQPCHNSYTSAAPSPRIPCIEHDHQGEATTCNSLVLSSTFPSNLLTASCPADQAQLSMSTNAPSRWDLRGLKVFRDYARKHARNWYKFVNGDPHMIANGTPYLVSGVTKSTCWNLASVEKNSDDEKLSLKSREGPGRMYTD
ncbi:hypothetical protein C8R43DRAFT_882935 [Mycena crocata]|nr:hypothetical protein C8R43DRAFT_882935 [Mycena crocata]